MTSATFLGACGTVTGSSTLLRFGKRSLLVDCGMYQGGEELEARNWQRFPFDPKTLDGVVVTHAHLDHVGLLPRLVAAGFHGPIWCTRPTRPLATLVLEDAGELQEEEARYAARKGYSRHAQPRALFDRHDAKRALQLFEPLRFHADHELFPGVRLRFRRAGHLLGAASLDISAKDSNGIRRSWCFSGDVGRYDVPILVDPEPPGVAPDALLLESTYGDRRHEAGDPLDHLERIVRETFERGGSLLVPAFALGRSQDVLYYLAELVERGTLTSEQIFLDSPMAIRATEIYSRATPEFDDELRELVRNGANPLDGDGFSRCRTVQESKALNDRDEPAVIVAASGMASGGRIVHHLLHRLGDPRTTLLFVGYQAAGTRGRALLDGASAVSIHGRRVDVRAQVRQLGGLSAHADCDDLVRWCQALPAPPERIFLNHGEDAARKALAATLQEHGLPRPELPLSGTTVAW